MINCKENCIIFQTIAWKTHQIGQTEHKLSLYADDVILFITKSHKSVQTF